MLETTNEEDELTNDLSGYAPQLSTEVLIYIFSFLNPKHLTKCREVCTRWKLIVDSLLSNERLWRKHCENDFADIYKTTYYKRKPDLSWRNLYRSLSLWSKLQYSTEIREEFTSLAHLGDNIRGFQILSEGEIGVHTNGGVAYYNLKTLKKAHRNYAIPGYYIHYFENEEFVIIRKCGKEGNLFIVRKIIRSLHNEPYIALRSVKNYLLNDGVLYYVTLSNEVYMCDLTSEEIKFSLLVRISSSVMCLGYKNGDLHALTYEGDIFTIVGKESIFQCTIYNATNVLHMLNLYNFLEKLDWRVYYQWMCKLRHKFPQWTIKDLIIIVKVYGDIVFVGSSCGTFRIYHSPYFNNELYLCNTKPVKEYNFTDRKSGMLPIIHIDVIEGVDSHTVLVCTPRKVAAINYCHNIVNNVSEFNFHEPKSVAIHDFNF